MHIDYDDIYATADNGRKDTGGQLLALYRLTRVNKALPRMIFVQ